MRRRCRSTAAATRTPWPTTAGGHRARRRRRGTRGLLAVGAVRRDGVPRRGRRARLARLRGVRAAQGDAAGGLDDPDHPRRGNIRGSGSPVPDPRSWLRHVVHHDRYIACGAAPRERPRPGQLVAAAARRRDRNVARPGARTTRQGRPGGSSTAAAARSPAPHHEAGRVVRRSGSRRAGRGAGRAARPRPRGRGAEDALRRIRAVPSVNARKFGSKPNATVPPVADALVDDRRACRRAPRRRRRSPRRRSRGWADGNADAAPRRRSPASRSASRRTRTRTARPRRPAGCRRATVVRIKAAGRGDPRSSAPSNVAEDTPTRPRARRRRASRRSARRASHPLADRAPGRRAQVPSAVRVAA